MDCSGICVLLLKSVASGQDLVYQLWTPGGVLRTNRGVPRNYMTEMYGRLTGSKVCLDHFRQVMGQYRPDFLLWNKET